MKVLIKKMLLWICLSCLVTYAIAKLNNSHNLSFYEYQIEYSTLEEHGAEHFPAKVPVNATDVVYQYETNDTKEFYQLSYKVDASEMQKIASLNEQAGNSFKGCQRSIKLDKDTNSVTYTHHRWKLSTTLTDSPINNQTLANR